VRRWEEIFGKWSRGEVRHRCSLDERIDQLGESVISPEFEG
jgi:hypothetical protein